MTVTKELKDLVEQVKVFSSRDLNTGAQILTLHTNPKFTDEPFENLYRNLRKEITNQPEQVEKFIDALKQIRTACLESSEAIEYVKEQANQMVEMSANGNFVRKYLAEDNEKSNGCSVS